MKNSLKIILFSIFGVLMLVSCNRNGKQAPTAPSEDILRGKVNVLVDETLYPIIKEQVDVFQSSYSDATIQLLAKPEIKAINALLADTSNVIILTRKLTAAEGKNFKDRKIVPKEYQIGSDAIALINNVGDADTIITLSDVKSLLNGTLKGKYKVVFDNANSSTLRFLKEYLSIDKIDPTAISALENNIDVIKYVSENKGSIGIVGFNWILDMTQKKSELLNKIRTLSVENALGAKKDGLFYKPSQSNISLGVYPFTRPIYVLNYQPNMGLGLGFSAFLTGDRGQRIFLKAGLLPATMPGRDIIIREENSLN
ncbi:MULTISPECIES: PstS family phosphate ABC transporter substrate-binding protein [Sphingobacterium]|uniref:Substrate-binding domain-containing protein n=1 Tax=Sphingobacterium kitahiroshimense TaxID=470446 RepID=A0ABV0C044_9SPHI|nr:substrate-binding domain-containing protein [Sphingobacterium sp. JUb56]MBB2954210.1 phosphate transport system substrate-binding protein [Sphingobacterium sp. JUb56]MBB2954419.1 phosphate transport system substrate-binding protein [Sphingobacterium sp. JUb56]